MVGSGYGRMGGYSSRGVLGREGRNATPPPHTNQLLETYTMKTPPQNFSLTVLPRAFHPPITKLNLLSLNNVSNGRLMGARKPAKETLRQNSEEVCVWVRAFERASRRRYLPTINSGLITHYYHVGFAGSYSQNISKITLPPNRNKLPLENSDAS